MPPGFGLLDSALVSIPISLAVLGLIRGAPVELASCLGCIIGIIAAWLVSSQPAVAALGQPAGPLIALGSGVAVWRLVRGLSNRLGLDTRWFNFGNIADSVLGFSMGGLRGVALVSAGCLAYAMLMVPLGLTDPLQTVAYPLFLSVGSQVTSAVIARIEPPAAAAQSFASVPLPLVMPQITSAPPLPTVPGAALSSLMEAVAPAAVAATMMPLPRLAPAYQPNIPVRQVPASLMETHHNLLHPHGMQSRRIPRR